MYMFRNDAVVLCGLKHTHTHTHTHARTHTHMHSHTGTHTHAHTHTYTSTHKHTNIHTHTHTRTCKYPQNTHTHTHKNETCICPFLHRRTHTDTCADRCTYTHTQRHTSTHTNTHSLTDTAFLEQVRECARARSLLRVPSRLLSLACALQQANVVYFSFSRLFNRSLSKIRRMRITEFAKYRTDSLFSTFCFCLCHNLSV